MATNPQGILQQLKRQLEDIAAYPWEPVEQWSERALPVIRQWFPNDLDDFRRLAKRPPPTGLPMALGRDAQENERRSAELRSIEVATDRQLCQLAHVRIVSFLEGLTTAHDLQGTQIQEESCMDVLISWSKPQSREMATLFHRWIPKVLPGVNPWMSDKDIDKGTDWWNELKGLLTRAKMCIICVTPQNVRSPWLYFETGTIAGKGENVRVCPYLVGLDPSMLADGPLGKYQCTAATKDDTLSLVRSLNKALDAGSRHNEGLLEGNFEAKWPEFERELNRIQAMDVGKADDFVETDADQLAGYKLTSEARTLLVEASKDERGTVLYACNLAESVLQTNRRNFVKKGNPRSAATWKQAIDDLVAVGLLEDRSGTGGVFVLTGRGYNAADLLRQ
ncbi:MAG: TIR domain-containing protein [Planctomycetaceae bacterium]|nr:TIR domain-containing protein [Planctomycetaceae bacterium]